MTKQRVKKFTKEFKSFDVEEQWLLEQAQNGWRLVSYSSSEVNECTYKFVQDSAAKEYRYKIDFREFGNKSDFEDYQELFKETGWTLLSKKNSEGKRIFISNSGAEIFSDQASIIEREIRRCHSDKVYALIYFLVAIISVGLFYFFENRGFLFATIMLLYFTAKYMMNANKRQKFINKARMGE